MLSGLSVPSRRSTAKALTVPSFRSPCRSVSLAEYRRVLRPDGTALIVEANRYSPSLFAQMTLVRGHQHFTRRRFEGLVRATFPLAHLGSFEAHYVPGARRLLGIQHRLEETLERLRLFRPLLSYNFAIARR